MRNFKWCEIQIEMLPVFASMLLYLLHLFRFVSNRSNRCLLHDEQINTSVSIRDDSTVTNWICSSEQWRTMVPYSDIYQRDSDI